MSSRSHPAASRRSQAGTTSYSASRDSTQRIRMETLHSIGTIAKDVPMLKAITVPKGYPNLDAKPIILAEWSLIVLLAFNTLCIAAVVSLFLCSGSDRQYILTDPNVHLVAQWLPTIIGTITTIASRSVLEAYFRIESYISMADESRDCVRQDSANGNGRRTVGSHVFTPLSMNNFFWFIRNRHIRLFGLYTNQLLIGFVTPLKAVFLRVIAQESGWIITISPIITIVLTGLYFVNEITLFVLVIHLWKRHTGLKYDPTTIADQLALFYDSNVLVDFTDREREFMEEETIAHKTYRLGYWELKTQDSTTVVYGVRREGLSESNLQLGTRCGRDSHMSFCGCLQVYESCRAPYWGGPVYGSMLPMIWEIIVSLALGACVIGIVKEFPKLGLSFPNSSALTASTFYWNGKPTLYFLFPIVWVSNLFALGTMQLFDTGIRFTQPFASSYRVEASLEESLLLDYVWGMPGVVTVDAMRNGHWKVAWFSFTSMVGPLFPVLVANMLSPIISEDRIIFKGGEAIFYTVFCFLLAYFLTLPFAWPGRNRRLPRMCHSIADFMSLFFASSIMSNKSLDLSDANAGKRLLESKLFVQQGRFETGLYTGADGTKHFGLDHAWIEPEAGRRKHVAQVVKVEKTEDGHFISYDGSTPSANLGPRSVHQSRQLSRSDV